MIRLAAATLLVLFAPAAAAPQAVAPAAPSAGIQIETELRLERKLLALDLAAYDEARTRERQVRVRVDEVAAQLDEALRGEALSLGALEALHEQLDAAREAARTAAARVDGGLQRLEERLRRIGFLESELGGRPAGERRDPVSGRWRVRILPQDLSGTFELHLAGTVVTGSYTIEEGGSGSLRGTLSGTRLRLERIDSRRGFDAVFEGTVAAGGGLVTGSWTATELAAGEPERGGWSAIRIGGGGEEGEPGS
jgi:hypothetical protein